MPKKLLSKIKVTPIFADKVHMRIIVIILMTLQLALLIVPRMYGADILPFADNSSDNTTDNGTDNGTDNSTGDNVTDNETDNETEDNETVKKLKALFAGVSDNYTCVNPFDPVLFPYGTRLENCVRHFTGTIRWPMLCKEAEQVTALRCDDPELTSLDGLQQFPNLINLSFSMRGTKVNDLAPIRNLTKLETLEIPLSNITEIGFLARMKRLRSLDLKGNHVTILEFLPFINALQTLALEYQGPTYLTDIKEIGTLTRLNNLFLQGNKITDITPLESLRNLTFLSIRDNRVSDLKPLSGLKELQGINFSINMISDISPIDNLTNLKTVIGNSNKISDLKPLENLVDVRDMQFMNNMINDIEPIGKMKHLKKIVMDYNTIKDVLVLNKLTLWANLGELSLNYNCIPKENYRKVVNIYEIGVLRLEHQCENFPKDIYPDNQTIVNPDLVNGGPILEKDNITLTPFESTAGKGCSAVPYETGPFTDAAEILLMAILIFKFFGWKVSGFFRKLF